MLCMNRSIHLKPQSLPQKSFEVFKGTESGDCSCIYIHTYVHNYMYYVYMHECKCRQTRIVHMYVGTYSVCISVQGDSEEATARA